jgi:hypothetical protein
VPNLHHQEPVSSSDVEIADGVPAATSGIRVKRDTAPPSQRSATSERSYLSVLPARKTSLSRHVAAQVTLGAVSTRQNANMFVAFDERHTPILLTTFEGVLDLDAVEWHDALATKAITAALSSGRGIVHIVDARRVEVPNAQLRRHWATRIEQSVGTMASMLGNFIVIDSPMLRGALTAIDWLCHAGRRIEYFSTLTDAVTVANLRLTAAGHTPIALDTAGYSVARGT